MNFSNLNSNGGIRIQRLQSRPAGVGSGRGINGRFPFSSIDSRNNNYSDKGDQSLTSAGPPSPRVPEIQMINKFYGLVPKKFVISERTRPTPPPPLIRVRSSTRPKSTKTARSSPLRTLETEVERLRRHSSVDDTCRLEDPSVPVPLVTRPISFQRNYGRKKVEGLSKGEAEPGGAPGIPALVNQRVIRIDLNHMRWEEETVGGEEVEGQPEPRRKSGGLRKTISFDETAFKCGDEEICKGSLIMAKERPITAKERPTTARNPEPPITPWTTGKTTAERRAKLTKSFSIHPSFTDGSPGSSVDLSSLSLTSSEGCSYPESMTRTGRKSLHVEPLPEVDTLISKTQASSTFPAPAPKVEVRYTAPIPTPAPVPEKEAEVAVVPKAKAESATEKRRLFKKSVSLPAEHEVKGGSTAKKGTGLRNSLSRQNSAAVTKYEVNRLTRVTGKAVTNHSQSGGSHKGKGPARVPVIKKTLVELPRLRPKTAPANNQKNPTEAERRRQPMKARSHVSPGPSPSASGSQSQSRLPHKPAAAASAMEKRLNVKQAASEEPDEGPPSPPPQPRALPRRSFSLDEGSLLTYSTTAASRSDSIENSIQNSRKREECLRIYEKMNQGGCSVRLQTIFRGMMTPSEYRMFITEAEKAAALAEAELAAEKENEEAGTGARPQIEPLGPVEESVNVT